MCVCGTCVPLYAENVNLKIIYSCDQCFVLLHFLLFCFYCNRILFYVLWVCGLHRHIVRAFFFFFVPCQQLTIIIIFPNYPI